MGIQGPGVVVMTPNELKQLLVECTAMEVVELLNLEDSADLVNALGDYIIDHAGVINDNLEAEGVI